MTRTPSAVVFRCDAGAVAGLGHVSRCLTLADAFRASNIPVWFVTADGPAMNGRAIIERRGHKIDVAPAPVGAQADLTALCRTLRMHADALVVVDSWNATDNYMNEVMKCAVTMRIHDVPGVAPPAHILVNAHLDGRYDGAGDGQLRLVGPRYNFIRPAFFARTNGGKERVVVTFGGEDPHNHSLWVLTELNDVLRDHRVDVIVGLAHPDPQSIIAAAKDMPNIRVVIDPPDMAELLVGATLAITAGGTTCYELAAAGTPQLAIVVEDHQWPLVTRMTAEGAMIALGDYRELDNDNARTQVRRLLQDSVARRRLAEMGRQLFTAPGAPIVVAAVLDYWNTKSAKRDSCASKAW